MHGQENGQRDLWKMAIRLIMIMGGIIQIFILGYMKYTFDSIGEFKTGIIEIKKDMNALTGKVSNFVNYLVEETEGNKARLIFDK